MKIHNKQESGMREAKALKLNCSGVLNLGDIKGQLFFCLFFLYFFMYGQTAIKLDSQNVKAEHFNRQDYYSERKEAERL